MPSEMHTMRTTITLDDDLLATAGRYSGLSEPSAIIRHALKDYLLGPNVARVVRHANCSVYVVRG